MEARLCSRPALSAADEAAMYALLARHFEGISPERFRADLDGKGWAVLLRRPGTGELLGFSTLHLGEATLAGERVGVVVSGDTIVDPSAWSSPALPRSWIGAVNVLRRQSGHRRLLWLLIVSGWRTYRMLPVFLREFFPRHDVPTPAEARAALDALAHDRYGALYEPEAGVVRFPAPQLLRAPLRGVPAERLADPHVAFFASRNPGHERGDELVCLAELSHENLTPAGRRMWAAGERTVQAGNGA